MAHHVNACLPTELAEQRVGTGEREEGRKREGVAVQWAHSRLDNHCDANCQGGKMSIGGAAKERERERERQAQAGRHELSKVQLHRVLPPSHDLFPAHMSWSLILWRCSR